MRFVALLAAVLMMTTAVPTYAEPDDCDNRAFFESELTTRPDTFRPSMTSAPAPPETGLGVEEAVDALVARADGLCMHDLVDGAEETGDFPVFGELVILYEIAYDGTTQHCNQGANVGPGGHYTIIFPPAPPPPPVWGFANSDISTGGAAGTAYLSWGFAHVVDTGKSFAYSEHVDYLGLSDFWCLGYFDSGFGDYVTVNFPFLEPGIVW